MVSLVVRVFKLLATPTPSLFFATTTITTLNQTATTWPPMVMILSMIADTTGLLASCGTLAVNDSIL